MRDKNLWRWILRGRATGTEPPELENYNQAEVIYNASLLVNGGYVDGSGYSPGTGRLHPIAVFPEYPWQSLFLTGQPIA
jgi:hypothetical protein